MLRWGLSEIAMIVHAIAIVHELPIIYRKSHVRIAPLHRKGLDFKLCRETGGIGGK